MAAPSRKEGERRRVVRRRRKDEWITHFILFPGWDVGGDEEVEHKITIIVGRAQKGRKGKSSLSNKDNQTN